MEYISEIPGAPKAVGPYSPATKAGGFAFLSGQIPLDPDTGVIVEGGIEAQARQVMKNISAVLTHMGLRFEQVAKTTIFLTDLSHFQKVNAIYEEALQGCKPARSTIQVSALPKDALVEIEMIVAL
jgi:2-iminobutanoate/2-iminopropanoate deaminase